MLPSSPSVGPLLGSARPPFKPGLEVSPIGSADIACEALPIPNLSLSECIRLFLGQAPGKGVAVDVFELIGQLADNPPLPLRLQLRQ